MQRLLLLLLLLLLLVVVVVVTSKGPRGLNARVNHSQNM